uniref:Uncharacterized protein n=1 Tax=Branchiostoma floridae TaxID=7739 RepID=C3ZYS4_BRAFL|eukprot:XP_002586298.1 hypothetical protein BRAFLDRAFT_82904 [Branchiostoma floridae]
MSNEMHHEEEKALEKRKKTSQPPPCLTSHCVPWYPGAHTHAAPPACSVQVPPCRQDTPSHGPAVGSAGKPVGSSVAPSSARVCASTAVRTARKSTSLILVQTRITGPELTDRCTEGTCRLQVFPPSPRPYEQQSLVKFASCRALGLLVE